MLEICVKRIYYIAYLNFFDLYLFDVIFPVYLMAFDAKRNKLLCNWICPSCQMIKLFTNWSSSIRRILYEPGAACFRCFAGHGSCVHRIFVVHSNSAGVSLLLVWNGPVWVGSVADSQRAGAAWTQTNANKKTIQQLGSSGDQLPQANWAWLRVVCA